MAPVRLIASPNDYLVEEAVKEAAEQAASHLGVEVEPLAEGADPADVALEARSPSLFAPARVLVVRDASAWLGAGGTSLDPLVELVAEGVPEEVALILGVCCDKPPKGPLAEVVAASGDRAVTWLPLPAEPKPWEELEVSADEAAMLRRLLERAAPGVRFEPDAESLLFERLGFDPRRLAAEAVKLGAAAGEDAVDAALVRRLVIPHDRSLKRVEEAVLERRPGPVLELLAAWDRGEVIRDWRGDKEIGRGIVLTILLGQVTGLLAQLLAVRTAAVAAGLEGELDPRRTGAPYWYPRRFKGEIGPRLETALDNDPDRLHVRGRRRPSPFQLGGLFAGASRWSEPDLVGALADGGRAETALRGDGAIAGMTAFVVTWLVPAERAR